MIQAGILAVSRVGQMVQELGPDRLGRGLWSGWTDAMEGTTAELVPETNKSYFYEFFFYGLKFDELKIN